MCTYPDLKRKLGPFMLQALTIRLALVTPYLYFL